MQRHHYVPQFYLNSWYVPERNQFWLYCHSERGGVSSSLKSSRAVCYQRGLYSTVPDGIYGKKDISDEIETEYLSPLDSAASEVHKKILLHGISCLSQEERLVWALFVNSLILRSPVSIEIESSYARKIADETICDIKNKFPYFEGGKYPWELINFEAISRNAALRKIINSIGDNKTIEIFFNMCWAIVSQPTGSDHFLTGDSPIVINGGGNPFPVCSLSFSISPDVLFVMYGDHSSYDEEFIKTIACCHSILVAKQTKKYLISSRELENNGHIKYKRVLEEIFAARA